MAANAGAIGVSAVSKVFPSGLEALRSVSVDIHPGEFVSFVGPSGCGKSTLLKLIGGLLEPSTGEIKVGGRKVSGPRRDVGVMFQTSVLFPWRTVLENVLLPIEVFGLERAAAIDKARGILRLVGLDGREGAYPLELLRIWSERGQTIIFVTHSINEAVFLSDRIVVMDTLPGRVLAVVDVPLARPRSIEVMKSPEFARTAFEAREYLGVAR